MFHSAEALCRSEASPSPPSDTSSSSFSSASVSSTTPVLPPHPSSLNTSDVSSDAESDDVHVALANEKLWKTFDEQTTEMIVTKTGRKLFPKLEYVISGLDPHALYSLYIQIVRVDDFRYKFNEGKWSPVGRGEAPVPGSDRFVPHQDGSWAPGALWMKSPVSFDRLKLTNDPQSKSAAFVPLSSMHKYQPILHIYKASSPENVHNAAHRSFSFEETHFVAVTAYQNQKIIQLKVHHNPFAKGFREGGSNRKRHSDSPEEGFPPPKQMSNYGIQPALIRPLPAAFAWNPYAYWNPMNPMLASFQNPLFAFPPTVIPSPTVLSKVDPPQELEEAKKTEFF
ncbi:hypothetical protein QR680_013373 [Steinernema hermaphroditum]|uniref:T-box domain-containing protein n=1 Tax=Steinernema hermaphroditum TaxID=289476 RepID=A0AA39I6P0_9BILA|nr:hypothetical protein QR680_013373 [Steinernema hermaphroditum]